MITLIVFITVVLVALFWSAYKDGYLKAFALGFLGPIVFGLIVFGAAYGWLP